jgi:hypothetical protein
MAMSGIGFAILTFAAIGLLYLMVTDWNLPAGL